MSEPPHGGGVPDLPTLLQRHLTATGEKQSDVVARARRSGHHLSRQQLSKLVTGFNRCPDPATCRAIAAGLGVTERMVWLSIGASLGLAVGSPTFSDRLPETAGGLAEEVQDALMLLLRAMSRSLPAYAPDPTVEPKTAAPDVPGPRGWTWDVGPSGEGHNHGGNHHSQGG